MSCRPYLGPVTCMNTRASCCDRNVLDKRKSQVTTSCTFLSRQVRVVESKKRWSGYQGQFKTDKFQRRVCFTLFKTLFKNYLKICTSHKIVNEKQNGRFN